MSRHDNTYEELFDKLGAKSAELQARAQEFLSQAHYVDNSGRIKTLERMKIWIGLSLGQFKELLSEFVDHRRERAEHVLAVLDENGIATPPKRHNWIDTLLATMPLTLFEGVIVGALMALDGLMSVPAGLSFGFIFALVNVVTGMLAGYFTLRYARYKANGVNLTPQDKRIQTQGKIGFYALLGVLVLLIFVAARVRATGSHEAVFSFNEISFFQTVNNATSIVVIVIASASSFVAIIKGYKIDPIIGLSAAQEFATDSINSDVEVFVFDTDDMITDRIESVLEDAYAALERIEDVERKRADGLAKINNPRREFNHEIDVAKNALIARQRHEIDRYEKIKGVKIDPIPDLGLEVFDALKLPLISDADYSDAHEGAAQAIELRALVSELEATLDDARNKIQVAHTQYRATQPNLSPTQEPKGV
ncbi:MAG: hypothetical protein COA69_08590 [Robiginitomaculum sp.]|nr:MAG: hypothetical protein COA69_08590 [Robiginitomaculum sp.]